jgi:hypothetical protein
MIQLQIGQLPAFTSWSQVFLVLLGALIAIRYVYPWLKNFKMNGNGNGKYGFRDASALSDKIMANVDKTRHDIINNLSSVDASLRLAIDDQTQELSRRLDEQTRVLTEIRLLLARALPNA